MLKTRAGGLFWIWAAAISVSSCCLSLGVLLHLALPGIQSKTTKLWRLQIVLAQDLCLYAFSISRVSKR